MTGTAIPYGAIVHYGAAEGTLTLKNTELIAPVAGTADEINSASPSVIGVAAWAQTGENIDEAWKLVVTDCTIRTNGFAVFDRWNNAPIPIRPSPDWKAWRDSMTSRSKRAIWRSIIPMQMM